MAFTTYRGYPALAPDGRPWSLTSALREYGKPLPVPILELCSMRTGKQLERERDEIRLVSARNNAWFRDRERQDAMAEEWEAEHA